MLWGAEAEKVVWGGKSSQQTSMILVDGATHFRLIPALSLGSALHMLLLSGPRQWLPRAVMGKPIPLHTH